MSRARKRPAPAQPAPPAPTVDRVAEPTESDHGDGSTTIEPEVLVDGAAAADEILDLEIVAADQAAVARALVKPGSSSVVPSDPLARYLFEIRRFEPLAPEEEFRLAREFRATGNQEAAAKLVSHNLLLVVKLALMYRRALRNVMDLIQEGNVGLMEALKRFDPDQGVRFNTYAAWWIKAYMLKFLLDNARLVRVGTTNARRKLLYNLRREQRKLEAQGVQATPKLLAERLDVPEQDVIEVDRVLSSPDLSTDQPIGEDGSATVGDLLAGGEPAVDEQVIAKEMREKIESAITAFRHTLGEREQAILDARLNNLEAATLQELGDRFGVTREAMRQAEAKLKTRLATFLRERLGPDVILHFTGQSSE